MQDREGLASSDPERSPVATDSSDVHKKKNYNLKTSTDRLDAIKNEILHEFKHILNKRGRRYIKDELQNIETALTIRNALWSLMQEPGQKVEFQKLKSSSSSSQRTSSSASPVSSSDTAESSTSKSSSHGSNIDGRPLRLRQAIVHCSVDSTGVPVTVAYEQVCSAEPLRRTPTKRLSRREKD